MRSMHWTFALVGFSASALLSLACTRSKPAPPPVAPDTTSLLSVFADTAQYRRHCVVPTGRPVDIKQPCLLLDQGRWPRRLPAAPLPRLW